MRSRCGRDEAFRRACVAAVALDVLLLLACWPAGILGFVLGLAYVMPRSIAP